VIGLLAVSADTIRIHDHAVLALVHGAGRGSDEVERDVVRIPARLVVSVLFVEGVRPPLVPAAFHPIRQLLRASPDQLGLHGLVHGCWDAPVQGAHQRAGDAAQHESCGLSPWVSQRAAAGGALASLGL
jgi:hypothetical protein